LKRKINENVLGYASDCTLAVRKNTLSPNCSITCFGFRTNTI